jgi:hypothetical protein
LSIILLGKTLKADENFKRVVESILHERNLLILHPTIWDTFGFQLPILASKMFSKSAASDIPEKAKGQ